MVSSSLLVKTTVPCFLPATMRTIARLILGVVTLLLFLGPCVRSQHCPAGIIPPELNSSEAWSNFKPSFKAGFMSPIVHSFLDLVQPNPFPKDLIIKTLNSPNVTFEGTIREVLLYEVGFLVCVAIGILYIILMPLIGLCFSCCRCCENCGGRMYQKQTNSINCRRRGFYWLTFLITFLILAGNVCMFLSNIYTHKSLNSVPEEFNNTLKNLQSYINSVPKQIDQVLNESFTVVDDITNNINKIGPLLGKEIQKLGGTVNLALDSADLVAQTVQNTSLLLAKLNATQKDLDSLQSNLTSVKDRIKTTLNNPDCMSCTAFASGLDSLSLSTSIDLSGLNNLQLAVEEAEKADLNAQIQNGRNFFENIPEEVTTATKDSVQGVQNDIQNIKDQVSQATNELPLDQLTAFANQLSAVQNNATQYTIVWHLLEKSRMSVAVVLCCLILVVVVCNLLGLMLGPAGRVSKDDPTDRSNTADCGGVFLMAGVGLSFIFSWVLMIVVLILFLIGGNFYTLICVPWKSQELFQLIDTTGMIPELQFSENIQQNNLTITDLYNDCEMNKSLWVTLHLENIINLNDYLNVSKYTGRLHEELMSTNITLPSIILLNSETKQQLRSFSAIASNVNISDIIPKVQSSSETNLSLFADKLEALANNQTNGTIKSELQNEAQELQFLQNQINFNINPLLMELNSEIEHLSGVLSGINGTVEDVLEKVTSAQDTLNNTTQTVKSKLTEFVDCQIGGFTTLTEWANQTITEQVGRCGPVAAAVNTVETIVCSQIVESLNAFWFSLGWCLVFFIPSIIFSVKLAKFYRRMKYKDQFLENIMMSPFPRANFKPY